MFEHLYQICSPFFSNPAGFVRALHMSWMQRSANIEGKILYLATLFSVHLWRMERSEVGLSQWKENALTWNILRWKKQQFMFCDLHRMDTKKTPLWFVVINEVFIFV